MDDLTREFLIESQEGLDRMERCLTDLEERPGDSELLSEIFRSVHTIKGTTGFLGFKRLETLAHAGENLLGLLRDGKLKADATIITALLQLLDGLRSVLKNIEATTEEGKGTDDPLIRRLEELQSSSADIAAAPDRRHRVSAKYRAARKSKTGPIAGVPSATSQTAVVAEKAVFMSTPSEPGTQTDTTIPRERAMHTGSAAESTLRVDVALLNHMMNLVGELVLTRNQILQTASGYPNMTVLSRRLDMVTADLRESVMKARMQPISNVFSKLPRLVRDLSQSLHRRVRLEMQGQDTELDKSLLEAVKDPLTHAVRNALDHGIEAPEVRHAAGKDPEGVLRLRAVQEGSHVIIEVSDDGAGISVERVREKAIERGLIPPERAAQLTEQELLQLIFLPGFSTASAVTNVSGRGVGMDVVRTNIEKIGGKVEVDSRPGRGTTLRLRIPLTLAIIPALIVRSLGQSFALPQAALSELVHVSNEDGAARIEWIDTTPLYRLRGKLLPLAFLRRILRPEAAAERRFEDAKQDQESFIAVLDADGRRFGLVVEGLADPEEIVVKPLSSALKTIGIYSGATVLGSGELALILDPGAIALRAGVTSSEESEAVDILPGESITESNNFEFLLVEVGGRNAAVPLEDVLRIEQVPRCRIEFVGHRPVLNFEGRLLTVEDSLGVLSSQTHPDAPIIVVVCRNGDRQVGILVSSVLDVAAGSDLFEDGSSQKTEGITLLKNRVTDIVGLGCVSSSLTSAASARNEWNEVEFAGSAQ